VLLSVVTDQVILKTAYAVKVNHVKGGDVLSRPVDHLGGEVEIAIGFLAWEGKILAGTIAHQGFCFRPISAYQEQLMASPRQVVDALSDAMP
jgi:hypothetical protein